MLVTFQQDIRLTDDPKQIPKHGKRAEDDSDPKSGSTRAMGSVDVLGKSRGVQKRISLELEMRTNNKHSKELHSKSYIVGK